MVTMCFVLSSCSGSKDADTTTSTTVSQDSTKAQGNTDDATSNGTTNSQKPNVVEGNKVEIATQPSTDKNGKPITTKKSETTKKEESTTKKSQKKTTTSTTAEYSMTTVNPAAPVITPDRSLDPDIPYTASQAMNYLQLRYDKSKNLVNLIEDNETNAKLVVFNVKDESVYSVVMVNLKTGKFTETNKKTGKKTTFNITDEIKEK